ncbi:uncharacterized protein N7511_006875 [Penicillium nucicola]|uniref:uncharacterized protein n=1 Tax=Penicillium nucicola TaxID=1850975 RepID=UPI0025456CFF|nr:uncharacterized protein N7511_006875 [Penicillium nucicola]KAJ5758181.1 hypothetical protein N7511_006875 [Penicillium nucicola]
MGTVDYRSGIAILQLIIFPIILVAAVFIWKRTGWRVGSKIWRYAVTLSLIRIAGSISSLLLINDPTNYNIVVAVAVCQMIGIAPLLLTFIGLLRQIDVEERLPPKLLKIVSLVAIIGLILGIAGVSSADTDGGSYHPGTLVKVAMAIFLVVFAVFVLLSGWLFFQLSLSLRKFQKKLFLAILISLPFLLVRLVYSALGDYTDFEAFALDGNTTVYLCMDVLEEIIAMGVTMALGISAVLEKDFVKLNPVSQEDPEQKPLGV